MVLNKQIVVKKKTDNQDKSMQIVYWAGSLYSLIHIITPSDAVIMECKFGIESALSIFTITCISALEPATLNEEYNYL